MSRTTGLEATQRAMFAALSGHIDPPVYDQPPEGAAMPYVILGGGMETMRNTFGGVGRDVLANVHIWSRSGQDFSQDGFGEAYAIQASIDLILDGVTLDTTASGWRCVLCQFETSQPLRDPDGISRHLMANYRVLLEAI